MKNLLYLSGLLIFTSGNRNVGNNWSFHVPKEVTGEVGKSTTLSCLFSHPQKTHSGPLTAIWRIDHPYNGTVVFKCMSNNSNDPCKPTINRMNKFQLIGNPHSNNLSISIGNLTWDDGNKYYCRVELSSDRHDKYETRTGTQLHLAGLAFKLLMLLVLLCSAAWYRNGSRSHSFRLHQRAQESTYENYEPKGH